MGLVGIHHGSRSVRGRVEDVEVSHRGGCRSVDEKIFAGTDIVFVPGAFLVIERDFAEKLRGESLFDRRRVGLVSTREARPGEEALPGIERIYPTS